MKEATYANTGSNLQPVTPIETPPPPPKSRPPALTPPITDSASGSVTNADAGDAVSQQKTKSNSAAPTPVQQVPHSHSSLPRPTSRSQTSSHEPHYQTHSLNRRSNHASASSSSGRPGTSAGFTSQVRSFVKSPGAGTTFSAATPFDEEFLCQLPVEDLVARIKILEAKNRKLVVDNGQMMKNLNQHISSLQTLKYQNFRLTSDNNELRDLTVYLDDERNRVRGLAKQWQDFGNHMSKVMKHEVSNYAKKLHQLEDKQFELVRENFELRQLCVLMDKAINIRSENNADASSGSNASSAEVSDGSNGNGGSSHLISNRGQNHVMISQQILEYIQSLEQRISQLEWEKKQLNSGGADQDDVNSNSVDQGIGTSSTGDVSSSNILTPPAIIMEAMRSLRIRETLSPSSTSSTLKDTTAASSSTTSSFRSRSVSPRKISTRI